MSAPKGRHGVFDLALERSLLEEMTAAAVAQAYVDEVQWVDVRLNIQRIDLDHSKAAERALEATSMSVRNLLLIRGHNLERDHLRSADLRVKRELPASGALPHAYERSVESNDLERQLGCARVPHGWTQGCVAFSSGMAALTQSLGTARFMLRADGRSPFVAAWSSYFETDALLRLEYGEEHSLKITDLNLASRELAGRRPEILLFEPVRYNWDLDVLDFSALVHLLADERTRPRMLIVDKTLTPTWSTSRLLKAIQTMIDPPIVFEVRSGLKLDQQGLEVANLGVVEVFSKEGYAATAEDVLAVLRLARTTTGTGLSRASLASLDVPFFLEESWRIRHGGSVLLQNAWMAERVADLTVGIIQEVVHPRLHETPDGHAPFIVMRLGTDDLHDHGFFLAALRRLLEEKEAGIAHGSSFGFRATRYETIVPRLSDSVGLFKIAVGSRSGPSIAALLDVLRQLATFRSFATMRAAMPSLREVVLT